jgi:hypothetical protein
MPHMVLCPAAPRLVEPGEVASLYAEVSRFSIRDREPAPGERNRPIPNLFHTAEIDANYETCAEIS